MTSTNQRVVILWPLRWLARSAERWCGAAPIDSGCGTRLTGWVARLWESTCAETPTASPRSVRDCGLARCASVIASHTCN